MKKTAVVTGAGRGIGLAVARQLGMDGCRIVMTARGRAEDYREAVSALISCGIETAYVQADISIPEDRRRIVEETVRLCGRIDILVNNAGVAPLERADLLDMTEESFDRVIGINTKGTMFLTQLVAKQMLSQEWTGGIRGYIVNISSCSAEVVSTNRGEYCVSKAGISMLTRLYADRLAIYSDLVMTNGYELLKKIDIPMVFFGANGRVTANGKELASKWYPEAAVNSPYKESYPYEHGGHVFFDVFPEEFNRDLLHFVNALDK